MNIERERFTVELFEEVLPLAQKCWDEATQDKGEDCGNAKIRNIRIEPNYEFYSALAKANQLVIITLRAEAKLKGYLIGFLYRSPHHKQILAGGGDSIYIEPGFRGCTAAMIERFEKEIKAMGAEAIGWPIHRNSPACRVLEARGYIGDEIVMEKNLCA